VKSAQALEDARVRFCHWRTARRVEVELANGVLNLVFESQQMKFVVSPNAPVRQIWVSAMARSYKLSWVPDSTPSRSTARRCRNCSTDWAHTFLGGFG